jgi:hypothetical protein
MRQDVTMSRIIIDLRRRRKFDRRLIRGAGSLREWRAYDTLPQYLFFPTP